MNGSFLKRIEDLVSAITRGDFSKGRDFDSMADQLGCTDEEARLLESLGLMSVKLEAREFALEQNIEELKAKNDALLMAKDNNRLFSMIFVGLFLAICLYVFLVFLCEKMSWHVRDSARIVEAIFLAVTILIIKKGRFSFAGLGVSLNGAVRSIRYMLPGTIAICSSMVVLKGLLILLDIDGLNNALIITDNFDLLFIVYLPVAFFQEFLARGAIQTAIESVLEGTTASFWAIITASALFGLVHIQLSVGVAFASFVCSLYWGYLFTREKNLAGVGLSHFFIGDLAYLLGFWDYLHII